MPAVGILALGEGQAKKLLVDLQEALSHFGEREVFFELFLVHGVFCLFDQVHVVTEVPEVQLPIEVVTVFFALQRQRHADNQ